MAKAKTQKQPATEPVLPEAEIKKMKTETRIVFNEVGTSGLSVWSGFINEAYNTNLQWPGVAPLFQRIRRSTPEIVTIARAFTAWGRHTNIVVDLPDKPTDDDKKYKDFIDSVFDDVEGGQGRLIETIVGRVPFDGWYWWEAVPGRRNNKWTPPGGDTWRSQHNDDLVGFRRFSQRDTTRFYQWVFDNNKRMVGVIQQDYPREPVAIALKDSLHMTFGDSLNPEGLSPLEAVWRLERLKYGFEVIMGIGFEHAAGYVSVRKTETGALSDDDKTNVKAAARAIMTAQEGNYALWPFGIEGQIMDTGFGVAGNILETIKYYSIMIYSVYMMQFVALNTLTGTGALASATDSSDISVFTFNAMMDGFAAQLDDQIGRRLYEWNKDSFPNLTKRPKIRITHIDKAIVLSEMGGFLSQLNGILPLGDEDYKAIREKSQFLSKSLPKKTPEQIAAEKLAAEQAAGVTEDQAPDWEFAKSQRQLRRVRSQLNEFGSRMRDS